MKIYTKNPNFKVNVTKSAHKISGFAENGLFSVNGFYCFNVSVRKRLFVVVSAVVQNIASVVAVSFEPDSMPDFMQNNRIYLLL